MKQSLKRNYFFVLFSLVSLLLYSCAEEKEFIKEENKKVIKFEQKTLDEVLQISTFNKAYQKLVKKNVKIGNSALAKSALEEEHDFTIDPEVVKMTEAEDGTKSYNMLITRPTTTDAFFENLVIVNDTLNNVDAFIIKYIPNEQATYLPVHNSYAFEGEKEIEQIVNSGRFSTVQIGNGCFYTVLTLCYDISPNYSAEFQVPHSPTSLCSANFIFTSNSLITCEPNETNTVYVGNNAPTTPPTGSNMGASGSGNANTIDLTIVPPCRINCIVVDGPIDHIKELKKLSSNSLIKQKINNYRAKLTTQRKEEGIILNPLGTINDTIAGVSLKNSTKFNNVPASYSVNIHMHQNLYYPGYTTTLTPTNPIPSDVDVLQLSLSAFRFNNNPNNTSIIVSRLGTFAIRITDTSKALAAINALDPDGNLNTLDEVQDKFEKDYSTSVQEIFEAGNEEEAMQAFVNFINSYTINGQTIGLGIFQATFNSSGSAITNWIQL